MPLKFSADVPSGFLVSSVLTNTPNVLRQLAPAMIGVLNPISWGKTSRCCSSSLKTANWRHKRADGQCCIQGPPPGDEKSSHCGRSPVHSALLWWSVSLSCLTYPSVLWLEEALAHYGGPLLYSVDQAMCGCHCRTLSEAPGIVSHPCLPTLEPSQGDTLN